jgi:hypothetical protein
MNERDKLREERRKIKEEMKVDNKEVIKQVTGSLDLKNPPSSGKTGGGRANKLVSYKRTTEMVKLILRGIRFTDIMEYAENEWSVCRRTATLYYKKALESFTDQFEAEREYEVDKHQMMLQDLYTKSYKGGDLNLCRLLLQDLAKMKGISIERVDVTSGGQGFQFNYQAPEKVIDVTPEN